MYFNIIVCCDSNLGIGLNNKLAWDIKEEKQFVFYAANNSWYNQNHLEQIISSLQRNKCLYFDQIRGGVLEMRLNQYLGSWCLSLRFCT